MWSSGQKCIDLHQYTSNVVQQSNEKWKRVNKTGTRERKIEREEKQERERREFRERERERREKMRGGIPASTHKMKSPMKWRGWARHKGTGKQKCTQRICCTHKQKDCPSEKRHGMLGTYHPHSSKQTASQRNKIWMWTKGCGEWCQKTCGGEKKRWNERNLHHAMYKEQGCVTIETYPRSVRAEYYISTYWKSNEKDGRAEKKLQQLWKGSTECASEGLKSGKNWQVGPALNNSEGVHSHWAVWSSW